MANDAVELLQGTLDLLILKTLSWGSTHGYGIARWIQQVTGDVLRIEEGSLYPALHRLEKRGWISSDWGLSENNRRAKYYELTARGKPATARRDVVVVGLLRRREQSAHVDRPTVWARIDAMRAGEELDAAICASGAAILRAISTTSSRFHLEARYDEFVAARNGSGSRARRSGAPVRRSLAGARSVRRDRLTVGDGSAR